ncbi:Protein of unknown function [Saccharopolyspora antimicrobica]|uniref:DUF3558 domain-containing protein n=1 Tax=Saccharopolyspora antimicrobica TaxID=455193 RepID=A0A1I4SRB4_9PSEU|nr:DUF3558 domain-containing protein [Saccharopolyspora antimicrobica]SFM66917.1 Protein of unknown function [Saccharopolyspora antimicrobica]
MLKRGAILGASLAMTALLAACGSQTPDTGGEQSPETAQTESGSQISNPKDAAAVPPCDFLSAESASKLGLNPQGTDSSDSISRSCGWYTPDERDRLALGEIANRPLSSYLDNRSQFADFEELTIAGHPAVRANRNDPKELGTCSIFLATKDDQILSSMASRFDKTNDPCGLAQQALEAAVPSLPAAK